MTVQSTLNAIRQIPYMVSRHKDGEWRVSICMVSIRKRHPELTWAQCLERQEAMACYSNDAEDAVGTATDMSRRWVAAA